MKLSRLYTVEGIILKRKSVGEADKILTVFTKQAGKIRVVAKGVRRINSRRSGHVELFSHVLLTLHAHGTMDIVTEAQAMRHGSGFETDATRMAYAYCMSELVDQLLPERQEHMEVFFLLTEALDGLLKEKDTEVLQTAMSSFIHELLWRLGYLAQSRLIPQDSVQSYIEHITERKLRTWPLLRALRD